MASVQADGPTARRPVEAAAGHREAKSRNPGCSVPQSHVPCGDRLFPVATVGSLDRPFVPRRDLARSLGRRCPTAPAPVGRYKVAGDGLGLYHAVARTPTRFSAGPRTSPRTPPVTRRLPASPSPRDGRLVEELFDPRTSFGS